MNKYWLYIEGERYGADAFRSGALPEFAVRSAFHKELYRFLFAWFSGSPVLEVQTSGSTGAPKKMMVEKKRMVQSAEMTCAFLGLKEGDNALLCMPLAYIAGKMMVVRALTAGLDIYPVTPSGNPLKETAIPFRLAAMTPMQVYNTLSIDEECERLRRIENLLIGGGAVDARTEAELKMFPNKIYATYGMTETLSHIAVRRLNGSEASPYYTPFPSVRVSLSKAGTLVIDAPLVASEQLYTNDVARINPDGTFRIVGRKDNVINSGGIKLQAEEIEERLRPFVRGTFAVTSQPDVRFGEIVVLVVEEEIDDSLLSRITPAHYRPKKIVKIPRLPLTETGKINRPALKQLAAPTHGNVRTP